MRNQLPFLGASLSIGLSLPLASQAPPQASTAPTKKIDQNVPSQKQGDIILSGSLPPSVASAVKILVPLCDETQCWQDIPTINNTRAQTIGPPPGQPTHTTDVSRMRKRVEQASDPNQNLIEEGFEQKYQSSRSPIYWLREIDPYTGFYKCLVKVTTRGSRNGLRVSAQFGDRIIITPDYTENRPFPIDQAFPGWLLGRFSRWMEGRLTGNDTRLRNSSNIRAKVIRFADTVKAVRQAPALTNPLRRTWEILNDKKNAVGTDARLFYLRHTLMLARDSAEWNEASRRVTPLERLALKHYMQVIQLSEHPVTHDIETALNNATAWSGIGLGVYLTSFLDEEMARIGEMLDRQIAADFRYPQRGEQPRPTAPYELPGVVQSPVEVLETYPPAPHNNRAGQVANLPIWHQTPSPILLGRFRVVLGQLRQCLQAVLATINVNADPASPDGRGRTKMERLIDNVTRILRNQVAPLQVAQEVNHLIWEVYELVDLLEPNDPRAAALQQSAENLHNTFT